MLNPASLTGMHHIEINRTAIHSSVPGASNEVPMVFLGHLFNDLDLSESPNSA